MSAFDSEEAILLLRLLHRTLREIVRHEPVAASEAPSRYLKELGTMRHGLPGEDAAAILSAVSEPQLLRVDGAKAAENAARENWGNASAYAALALYPIFEVYNESLLPGSAFSLPGTRVTRPKRKISIEDLPKPNRDRVKPPAEKKSEPSDKPK